MEAQPREIEIYESEDGKGPFTEWLNTLSRQKIYGIILNRLVRVQLGNFGDHHSVGEGVCELVIDFGPGYRVYYGLDGKLVIILCGGTKGTQTADIARAQKYWRDYNA